MYTVGDKVVHPGYGPGVITAIENRQVIGEAKDYYVIDMLSGGTTLMTPVAQAERVGLRLAIGDAAAERIFGILADTPRTLSDDFRRRQSEVDELLRDGDIFVTAEVIRDMTWFGHHRGLTKRDSQLLQRAEELIASELALVRGLEVKEETEHLRAFLQNSISEAEEI
jgi:CarD family transcriptional regulator